MRLKTAKDEVCELFFAIGSLAQHSQHVLVSGSEHKFPHP